MDMEKGPLLKDMLFSTPLLKVLDFLLQHPEITLIDTEIAGRLETGRKSAVNLALRRLAHLGIIRRTHRGRMVFNSLIESALTSQLKVTSNLLAIQDLVGKLSPLSAKIVLFGSRADGTHTSESDFDMLAVTTDEGAARKIVQKHPLADKIQLLVKAPEQILTLEKDEPVLSEQIRKGIVLWERE